MKHLITVDEAKSLDSDIDSFWEPKIFLKRKNKNEMQTEKSFINICIKFWKLLEPAARQLSWIPKDIRIYLEFIVWYIHL